MELQTGPHAYTYDVDPRFTHVGELVNHSGLRPIFTEALGRHTYRQHFDSRYFDMEYIESIVAQYLAGEEIQGAAQADIMTTSMIDQLGWISD